MGTLIATLIGTLMGTFNDFKEIICVYSEHFTRP